MFACFVTYYMYQRVSADDFTPPVVIWYFIGSAFLVAVPVYVLLRCNIYSPMIIVSVLTREAFNRDSGQLEPATPLYLGLWFLPLGIALLVGVIEYALRSALF